MKIIHVVKFASGHSSGFNKQIPLLVRGNKNNYVYNIGVKQFNNIETHLSFIMFINVLLKNEKVVIHFHSFLSFGSVFLALISLLFKKKIVYSPRGEFRHSAILSNSSIKKLFFFKLIKPILLRSSVHFLSEVECAEFIFLNGVPMNSVVIPNAVIIHGNICEESRVKLKQNEFRILYVGRILIELKNIRLLLSSVNKLQSKVNEFGDIAIKIQLVGSFGSLREKKKFYDLLKEHNAERFFDVIDEVSNFEIGDIMSNANLLYNLSFSEGFPNIVLEALKFNLPILCSQNTGIQHYFLNSNFVKFCSLSPSDFVSKVYQIITSSPTKFEGVNISMFEHTRIQKEFADFYSTLC